MRLSPLLYVSRPTRGEPLGSAHVLALTVLGLAIAIASGSAAHGNPERVEEPEMYPLIPHLPGIAERFPDMVDARGCVEMAPDEWHCPAVGADPDAHSNDLAGLADWASLRGFAGAGFRATRHDSTANVVVLEDTITHLAGGQAVGLVRNDTTTWYSQVQVTASVKDTDGRTVEEATTAVLVEPLRPGEPAPFQLSFTTAGRVGVTVAWHVAGTPVEPSKARDYEILVHWQAPAHTREWYENQVVGYRDGSGADLPGLLVGSVNNVAGIPLALPSVTVAWMDGAGRVLSVEHALAAAGRREARQMLPTDYVEFLVEVPDEQPGVTTNLAATIWATGGGR